VQPVTGFQVEVVHSILDWVDNYRVTGSEECLTIIAVLP